MSHYAKILDGKVVQVIVAEEDFFDTFVDSSPGQWLQTSYNTVGNEHRFDGTPLRGNYAGIGYVYDHAADVFYAPRPFASWILNNDTWLWAAPVDMPADEKQYQWDEPTVSWIELSTL